jgi:hypothetical protein
LPRLTEQLTATDKELETDERHFAGLAGERDFLWEEIDRYRNRLMDFIRWDAMLPEDLSEAVRKVRIADPTADPTEDERG